MRRVGGGCGAWVVGVASGVCVLSCESHIIRHTESGERERERWGGGVGMQARQHTHTHARARATMCKMIQYQ